MQCDDCPLGGSSCPVHGIHMIYNYDQVDDDQKKLREAMNMLVSEKGVCEVRKQILDNVTRTSTTTDTEEETT